MQPLLIGAIIACRAGALISRVKVGLEPRSPMLAPFAWTYYLTEEEKRSALKDREFSLESIRYNEIVLSAN